MTRPRLTTLAALALTLGVTASGLAQTADPASIIRERREGLRAVAANVEALQAIAVGRTDPRAGLPRIEAIATFFLMLAVMGTAVDKHGPKIGGLAIGMTLTAGMLAIGPLTGGSMNPARSIGPMIATGAYEGIALYLAAPIVGAVVAAVLYRYLLLDAAPE